MHVTCPSCKFGGTVRDDQIPPDGKEVYCPNCNTKFRIKKDRPFPANPPQPGGKTSVSQNERNEYLPISCPVCGFRGKLKRSSIDGRQPKKITCPSCKSPFTYTPSDTDPASKTDTTPSGTPAEVPSSCPGCGMPVEQPSPVCPSCGRILTGTKICCPSCKSMNVGISGDTHDDGRSQWETMIFRPVSTAGEPENIQIPLSCRDCGRSWKVKPALVQTAGSSPNVSPRED